MQIIYSNHPIPALLPAQSVFLAGPTPRDSNTKSWRPNAIKHLNFRNYSGAVFYPEWDDTLATVDYDSQVGWEQEGFMRSLFIVFWIPRELNRMPAFTTNVEFGRFAHFPNTLYGRPTDAPKNKYLDWYYKQVNRRPIYDNLESLLDAIVFI